MGKYRAISEYYDPECEGVSWLERDVPFLIRNLPKKPQDVLEIACGTGRAAIPLAQAGHRVTAFDYAPEMLAIARRKRDAVGLDEASLKLVRADALRFRFARKFDWAVLLFNTFLNFTTLKQQDRVLGSIRRHLRKSGRLWLDIFQPNLEILSQQRSINHDPHTFYVPSLNRTVSMVSDIEVDPARQVQTVIFRYRWFDERGKAHNERTRFQLTFLMPRELQLLLERNGFKIIRLFGDYDGGELNADSARMIALCGLK